MLFSGVFFRHRRLRMVLTEQPGSWWNSYLTELDMVYRSAPARRLRQTVPELPSEACRRSLYVGASFTAPFEALEAERDGYADRLLWGSDYPHVEGTWQLLPGTATTHLALRHAFAGRTRATIRAIAGENAAGVYGFDLAALRRVADRINAPTTREVSRPLLEVEVPEGLRDYSLAFRGDATWV
jgi:predicted TIM-barrel fold metal-dependent hydrolase